MTTTIPRAGLCSLIITILLTLVGCAGTVPASSPAQQMVDEHQAEHRAVRAARLAELKAQRAQLDAQIAFYEDQED